MKKSKLIFALIFVYTISNQLFCNYANAQCDAGTPTFTMNLIGKADSAWISPSIARAQTCCALSPNCIEFNVTIDVNSIGFVLEIISGLPAGGSTYNVNCSGSYAFGTQVMAAGIGPHKIIFCKPGNNLNEYRITAIPRNITIPDANFKAALVANTLINTNLDGEIQVTEASTYSGAINVSSLSITSLTGIEEFPLLSVLNCDNNSLASLPISANTALSSLNCGNNPLTTINTNANTALTSLICSNNQLTTLTIAANTALTYLDCSNNPLMTSLDVSANVALTDLSCLGNAITSLNLTANTALVSLYCQSNQLTSLSISANTALMYLNCTGNLLTSLDVANNALAQLECGNNSLTSLDVSNTSLNLLNCYNNNLTSLDLSSNPLLYHLECYSNQITDLNLTANSALTYLYCFSNQLTSLSVKNGNNVNLNTFNATLNTSLTCIEVDNSVFMNTNFAAGKDAGANYNTNCAGIWCNTTFICSITVNSLPVTDGEIFLFKQNSLNNRMDTIAFSTISSSTYTFNKMLSGNYLVYYKPNSASHPNTPGTYNGNVTNWNTGILSTTTCNTSYTININATTFTTFTGPGAISGKVKEGTKFGKTDLVGDPIPGVDVSLEQNPGGIMVAQTTTDVNGDFSFTNLPLDDYRINVNIPGTPHTSYHDVSITATEPSISNLTYIVDSTAIYPLSDNVNFGNAIEKNSFKIIPNPFDKDAQVILPNEWKNNNQELLITITDISGKLVYSKNYNSNSNITINRGNLDNGLYFITIKNETKLITQKIVLVN